MNSLELIKQANARAEQLSTLTNKISRIEELIPDIRDKELNINGHDIASYVGINVAEITTQNILMALISVKNEHIAELEQLLGIQQVPETTVTKLCIPTGEQHIEVVPSPIDMIRKPAIINEEFEAATKDMFDAVRKSKQDPIEEKLSEILKKEEDRISGAAERSLDKYPAPKSKKSAFPETMTVDAVRKMYVEQGMTQKDIANYFGVKRTKVNTFLQKHKLFRGSYKADKVDKQPDDKERPSKTK